MTTEKGQSASLDVASGSPLRTAPDRQNEQMHGATGIFLRAIGQDGRWGSYDMAELDAESLTAWLKRDGGDNALAENCVRILLGHPQIQANVQGEPRRGLDSTNSQARYRRWLWCLVGLYFFSSKWKWRVGDTAAHF